MHDVLLWCTAIMVHCGRVRNSFSCAQSSPTYSVKRANTSYVFPFIFENVTNMLIRVYSNAM